jgi:hypothetical protein
MTSMDDTIAIQLTFASYNAPEIDESDLQCENMMFHESQHSPEFQLAAITIETLLFH